MIDFPERIKPKACLYQRKIKNEYDSSVRCYFCEVNEMFGDNR